MSASLGASRALRVLRDWRALQALRDWRARQVRAATGMALASCGIGLGLGLGGCADPLGDAERLGAADGAPGAARGPSSSGPKAEDAADGGLGSAGQSSARRPARRYYLSHGLDRCVVYWLDGTTRSSSQVVRCPRETVPGETLRLAGRTCFRQGPEPSRNVPVRCPDALTDVELGERQDAGLLRR